MGLNITGNTTQPVWSETVKAADNHELQSKWQANTPLAQIQEDAIYQFTDFMADLSKEFLSGLADNPNKDIQKSSLKNVFNALYTQLVSEDGFASVDQNNLSMANIEQAITNAHKNAIDTLLELQEIWADSVLEESQRQPIDIRPQIIRTAEREDGTFEYAVLKRPLPPKILALCGGGAKGIVYPAALKALEEAGQLASIETYSGTSAGGITSACLATGMTVDQYEDFTNEVQMDTLKQDVEDFSQKYTGITINWPRSAADLKGHHSGQMAIEKMDTKLSELTTHFLSNNWDQVEQANLTAEKLERLETLRDQTADQQPRDPVMLTFKDLSILREVNPEKFKNLELTGFNLTQTQGVHYNATTTPDLPIAYAVRITMSLPTLFTSVSLPGSTDSLIDGGYYTNVPKFNETEQTDTLVMAFSTGDYVKSSSHGPSPNAGVPEPGALSYKDRAKANGFGALSGFTGLEQVWIDDKQKIFRSGANVIEMKHGEIETTDLNAPPEKIEFAKREAYVMAKAHLSRTENSAVLKTYTSLEALAESLTPQERQAILDKGTEGLNREELGLHSIVETMLN